MARKVAEEEHRLKVAAEGAEQSEDVKAAAAEAYAKALADAKADMEAAEREASEYNPGEGGGVSRADDGAMADKLAEAGIVATYSQAGDLIQHRNAKDIKVENLTVSFHGANIIDNSTFTLNWGNRYGFIGRNGSGKTTVMRVIGARAVPIPETISMFHLTTEYPATEMTAIDAVMSVDAEREAIEKEIDGG